MTARDRRLEQPLHRQTQRASAAILPGLSARRRWVFRLFGAALAIVVALATGEIIVRVFEVGPDVYPLHDHVYTLSDNAGLLFELVPGGTDLEHDVTVNADGMRDRQFSIPKPPGTYRIACVGDSVCFGWDLGQSEPYPKRLEELLNRCAADSGRTFEVLNFGVSGYNLSQIVENVRVRVLKYEPDLILYGYCLNDPERFSFTYESLRARLTAAEKSYADRLVRHGRSLAQKSRLYLLTHYLIESTTTQGQEYQARLPDRHWLTARKNDPLRWPLRLHQGDDWRQAVEDLTTLAEITRSRGIDTRLVIFPFFESLGDYPLVEVHRLVGATARRLSLGAIDLLDDYQTLDSHSPGPFHLDLAHPNAEGHLFAAVAVLGELLATGVIPVADDAFARLASAPGLEGEFARLLQARPPTPSDGDSR